MGPEEVRTLNLILTVLGIKALSSKHVRYGFFTTFPGCGKKACVILLTSIMMRRSDYNSNERPDLALKHTPNFMKARNCHCFLWAGIIF